MGRCVPTPLSPMQLALLERAVRGGTTRTRDKAEVRALKAALTLRGYVTSEPLIMPGAPVNRVTLLVTPTPAGRAHMEAYWAKLRGCT